MGGSFRLPLLALVALLAGCARENPAYGSGAGDAGQSGGQTAGSTAGTTTAATTKTSASAGATGTTSDATGPTGDPDTSGPSTSSPPVEDTGPPWTSSGGTSGCPVLTLPVQSDTFVSNAEAGCNGGSCADWTFTGATSYDIRSWGMFDSIMLLRFVSLEPVQVAAATLRLHIDGAVPNESGLIELHVLESLSVWDDGDESGPASAGQPTWNQAARGEQPWIDGAGVGVPDFDDLHNGWPTLLVTDGDEADGVLELPIQAADLPELNERLNSSAPVQIGVTVISPTEEGAITARAMDGGWIAQLELVVDCG